LFEHLPLQEKINFSRHLSIVIKAGLPLIDGLRVIKNQLTSKMLIKIVDRMIEGIDRGQSLADSLEDHKNIFGDFFINIVRVGEASGTLSQNLVYLSEELKKSKDLKRKVKSALVYPIIILIATVAITAFLTFVVFPKIIPVFSGLDIELPATTKILISVLDFSKNYGWLLLGGIIALLIGLKFLSRVKAVKYLLHRSVFFIPTVSNLVAYVNIANFSRILGLLLRSGVRIVEAITITSGTFDNLVYRRILSKAEDEVRRGEQLAEYLSKYSKFFPPLLTGMVQIGENTGNLEENLFYLADYYTEEVDNKIHGLTNLLEPVLLLVMGLLVGFVAISIIMPIYSISQGLGS